MLSLSNRYIRAISTIVLSFFLWTFGGIFEVAYAVKGSNQPSAVGTQQKQGRITAPLLGGSPDVTGRTLPLRPGESIRERKVEGKKAEEKFGRAMEEIEKTLADTSTDSETRKQRIKSKKAEIDSHDIEIRKQFTDTEAKIKDLPEIVKKRHRDFVKKYEDNLQTLRTNLDDIDRARTDQEKDLAQKKTRDFLEKVKPPRKHKTLDPNKLPHRTPEIKHKEPRTKPEEFLEDRNALAVMGNGLKDFNNSSRITRHSSPILLAMNGEPTGLLSSPVPNPYSLGGSAWGGQSPEPLLLALADPPTTADLAENGIEIVFTPAITAKAAELGHDPTKIYNWVRNNIEFAPTYGSIQGADMCLQTKLCNDFDTASLLVGLLRASGIHARYVYGTIELPIEKVKNWLGGFTDTNAALALIIGGGIPASAQVSGGSISSVRLEHMWVEAFVDYIPSRGARHKTGEGDTWIRLDASYKQHNHTAGIDIANQVPFDSLSFKNQILQSSTINEAGRYATGGDCQTIDQTMIDYRTALESYLNSHYPDATMAAVLGSDDIGAQDFPYLLGTLPYKVIVTGQKTTAIPESLRHKIQFKLKNDTLDDISISMSLPELAGRKITLGYVAAAQADLNVINSYLPDSQTDGSVNFTQLPATLPAYLINIKPELRIDGLVLATGSSTGLGRSQTLTTTFTAPNIATDTVTTDVIAGEYFGIAIDTGRISEGRMLSLKTKLEAARNSLLQSGNQTVTREDVLGDLFYAAAASYFAELDKMTNVRSKLMGVKAVRLPSEAIYSSRVQPTYTFGTPLSVTTDAPSLDVARKMSIAQSLYGSKDRSLEFAFISGMDSSALPHLVPEILLGAPSASAISAVRVLGAAKSAGINVFTIDSTNITIVMPQLQLSADVKTDILNAVNAGRRVIAPQVNVTINGWTGSGYVVINPVTGDSAYMVSDGFNGGLLQGLPWTGNSLALNLNQDIAPILKDLSLQWLPDTTAAGLGAIASGTDMTKTKASAYLDLLTQGYAYSVTQTELGCYINLSTPAASLGSCMALYLGSLCIAQDTEPIASSNTAPIADAGAALSVTVGEMVVLDGSGSKDPDKDPLTYQWTLLSAPTGSTALLSSNNAVRPWFITDKVGTYKVRLTVSDGKSFSSPSTVTVKANQKMVSVPDITGLAQADAESAIAASGLVAGTITSAVSATVPTGKVISQNPSAGTVVNRDSSIAMEVSSGSVADSEPPVLSAGFDRNPPVYTAGETVKLGIGATDNSGNASVTVTLDGTALVPTLPITEISTTGYTAGSTHTVVITATDTSSNTTSTTMTFGIKNPALTIQPTVAITSPADAANVTAPVTITGTADSQGLLYYQLWYSPVGKSRFLEFGRGTTAVTNGPLGNLDPTLLKNGLYDILLTATDVNGVTQSSMVTYQISGDMKVGNFTVSFTDVNIPVAGIPVTVTRTYDSRDKTSHDFGYGWTIDIQNIKIEESMLQGVGWYEITYGSQLSTTYCIENDFGPYVAITLPDGKVEEFDMAVSATDTYHKPNTPANCQYLVPFEALTLVIGYNARPGTTSTLKPKNISQLYFTSGLLLDLDTLEPYDPMGYTLTTVDGMVFDLDQNYGVRSVTDPNGNKVTYNTGGITHSAGKGVTFVRDSQNRITKITDPNGGSIIYEYDTKGDLASVTDQNGNKTIYTYNQSHGLTDIKDPRGITPVRNIYDSTGRLTAHIDAYGNRIEYSHDIAGRQEIVKDRNGNQTVFIYDNKGRVLQKTDPKGNSTTFTYDSIGNKLSETDPLGNTTSWTYDAKKNKLSETKTIYSQTIMTLWTYNDQGKVLTTTDPKDNVTTNTYDLKGNLLTTTDGMGNVTTNTYDLQGNLLTTTDALGNITRYEYDNSGNRTKQTDSLGHITTSTYDSNGNKKTDIDARGGIITYIYDASNRQISVTDPLGNITRTEYDKAGDRTATIDALGIRITFVYNSAGKLIQTNYPDYTTTQITYDPEGNRVASRDQEGRVTTFEYDSNKQLVKTTYADGSTQSYGYDNAGRQTTVTDALGNISTKVYDILGRMTQSIDPAGNTTTFEYDINGNQTTVTDANGNATTFVYDANNRQVQTILAGGQTMTIGYDALDRKISETDAANNTTQFGYDAKGQLTSVTDALNNVTRYEYDANGNKTAVVDARDNRTTFAYDLGSRMISKTMPNGGLEIYTYDAAGKQTSKTDAKSQTIQYAYDSRGQVLSKSYPDNSAVKFSYTQTGRRATATDKRGVTQYAYDNRGRLTQMTYPDNQAINYTYDLKGNVKTISSLAGTVTYNYSSCCGRLESVTDPQGKVTTYTYDLAGNRTGLAYPNGTVVSYNYDFNNRLTNLVHKNSVQQVMASYAYTLGPIGNRTGINENTGITRAYEYDKLYRLTKETVTDPASVQTYENTFAYDTVGNRLAKSHSTQTTDYTYNNADQLITENGIAYSYDLNGNLASKSDAAGTTTYAYDYNNRLIRVASPSSTTSYIYDSDGNRVETTGSAETTKYLVDTNRSLSQVLAEYRVDGSLISSYIYADDLISMARSGQTFYYHFDGLGSTRLLTNSSGLVSDSYDFDAYGNLIQRTGNTENPFLFTGQQYDSNIGYYYLRARYYQPTSGRFTSIDPYAGDPYAPMSLHRYLYAADDPVNKIDPSGEMTLLEGMIMVGTITLFAMFATPSFAGSINRGSLQALRAQKRVQMAHTLLSNMPEIYAYKAGWNPMDWHWKCNEFVYDVHMLGDPFPNFPTKLQDNGYFIPNVADLANPNFASTVIEFYQSVSQAKPGDILVWYSKTSNIHHSGLYIGNGEVIYAAKSGLIKVTVMVATARLKNVAPIVRRSK